MYVKDHMQAITMTVGLEDRLSTARRLMHDLFIRHLPVVLEGSRLVGILTDRDLRQVTPSRDAGETEQVGCETCHAITVGDIMTRSVCTVSPDTALVEAASILLEQKFDCLSVVDERGAVKGLITASDFVCTHVEQHENVIV